MDTMLHEFGHAVYDKYVNPSLPYLLRTVAHTNSTEAVALMMGGWRKIRAGSPPPSGFPRMGCTGHAKRVLRGQPLIRQRPLAYCSNR